MAWSEADSMCRKHPNENPQPGICASCLRDRLSGIASGNNNNTYLSSPSAAYYYFHYSSASSSGGSSPAKRHRGGSHQRFASDIVDSIYLAVSGNNNGLLKKSRSMAFASRNINGERDDDHGVSSNRKKEKKRGGFWHKLLLLSSVNKVKF